MASPSLALSVALVASFFPLINPSRSYSSVRRKAGPSDAFSDTLSELKGLMKTKLHEDKVIPEIINEVPEQPVAVFYPHARVMMGNHIDPAALRHVPQFFFRSKPGSFYTIMLLGPDYPAREAPSERNRLMWLVTNFARNATFTLRPIGLFSYEQPHPRRNSGKMRFVFLVYEQPTDKDWRKNLVETPLSSTNFMLEWYVDRNGLTLVAANYFIIDTEQQNSSITERSLGRVTDGETVAVTRKGKTGTGRNNSDTGEKKSGTRENEDRIGKKVADTGEKVARTGEKVSGAGAMKAGTGQKATSVGEEEAQAGEKMTTFVEKEASVDEKTNVIGGKKDRTAEKATNASANSAGSSEEAIGTGAKEAGTGGKATGAGGKAAGAALKEVVTGEKVADGNEKKVGTFKKQPSDGKLPINASKNMSAGARFLETGAEKTRTEARRVEADKKQARSGLKSIRTERRQIEMNAKYTRSGTHGKIGAKKRSRLSRRGVEFAEKRLKTSQD